MKLSELRQNTYILSQSLKLKDYKDLVDMELVHFACNGYRNNETNKTEQVIAFTSDPYFKVLNRISFYKSLCYHAISSTRERWRLNSFTPGKVAFIDRASGAITNIIETQDVPMMLDILTEVQLIK